VNVSFCAARHLGELPHPSPQGPSDAIQQGGKDVQNGSTSTLQGFDEFPVNAEHSSFPAAPSPERCAGARCGAGEAANPEAGPAAERIGQADADAEVRGDTAPRPAVNRSAWPGRQGIVRILRNKL